MNKLIGFISVVLLLTSCANRGSLGIRVSIVDFGASPESPDNTQSIQKALNYVATRGGGTVLIPEGVFSINLPDGKSLSVGSNTVIKGKGRKTVLLLDMAKLDKRTHVISNSDPTGNERIQIADLTIDCAGLGSQDQHGDNRVNAITIRSSSEIKLINLHLLNGHGYGIWLVDTHRSLVQANFVQNFHDGIELSNGSSANRVTLNTVYSDGKVTYVSSGILCYTGADQNLIDRNKIVGGFGQGISTSSGYGSANYNTISNNTINVYNTVGLLINGIGNKVIGNHIKVKYNTALLFDHRWWSCDNTTVIDNVIVADLLHAPPDRRAAIIIRDNVSGEYIANNSILLIGEMGATIADTR